MNGYRVAVLFCTPRSVYKSFPDVDAYCRRRDARSYELSLPVVAHPPCRAWGKLSHLAKPRQDERELALFALEQVRRCGGVLEHPRGSRLWSAADLPRPGCVDRFGGWTLGVNQLWWGHRAEKSTLLYICGISPRSIPVLPLRLDYPSVPVEFMGRPERERTPRPFALWLVELASRCRVGG